MDTGYKMYAEIIREKLEKVLGGKGILDDSQMGSRKGKGTMNTIYILSKAVEMELKKKEGKVYAFFPDMRAVLDKVKRKEVWHMMRKLGIGDKTRTRVEEIYEDTKSTLRIGDKQIREFDLMQRWRMPNQK